MALLDRLRRRPRWEDPDPKVRAEGVREIPAEEQDQLAQIATGDADPLVRRAAVRRLSGADVLARIAAGDEDAGVREKAAGALVTLALGAEAATAVPAGAALTEAGHLTSLALSAALPAVRADAVGRLRDAHAFSRVARSATDPEVRRRAVASVTDGAALAEIAARSEHKDAAVAAVDRIEDVEALRTVAARARNKAAARRARERMEVLRPAEVGRPAEDEGAEGAANASGEEDMGGEDVTSGESAVGEPAAEAVPDTTESSSEAQPEDVPGAAAPPAAQAEPAADMPAGEESAPEAPSLAPRLRADRKERTAQAEALCARLTALVAAKPFSLRDAEVALREARLPHDDLAALPPKLARQLREARAALFARAQEAREAEEWSRWGNATAQEELCRCMEALAAQTDLEKVAKELRTLDGRWAEVRIAPRDEATSLRQRYQTARAPIKEKLDAYFAEKAARENENLRLKQELAGKAEALADSTEWMKASEELKALQARWKEIGPAPRKPGDAAWKRFRAACDRFFSRRQEDLKKRKQEWAANMARKQALCERAEALAGSTDWEATAAEARKLQAEWKTVGPVRRDRSEAVWQRFRTACDAFFERYKHRDEAERQARLAQREAVVKELEALVASAGTDPAPPGVAEEIQKLVAQARQGTPAAPADEEALSGRIAAARERAVAAWPEAFRGTDLDPEAGRTRREKLLARVESLTAQAEPPASALSGQDLARRLKEALATNTMGGRGEVEAKRRAEVDEVKAAQAAWRR
ncbi:MAG TPA: DUF349 domain-containing protein, partial [Vicinamibacteria bacterium]|nr:DUF349 domain-containing protein [Vicinamibacteria bacterium]